MQGEDATYWATIAQIVPVLLLALGLEAREITRRWAASRAPRTRRDTQVRVAFATAWTGTATMLMIVMLLALVSLDGFSPGSPAQVFARGLIKQFAQLAIFIALAVIALPSVVWAYRNATRDSPSDEF